MRINRREFFKSLTAGGAGLALFPLGSFISSRDSFVDRFALSSHPHWSDYQRRLYETASHYGSELGGQEVRLQFFRI